MNYVSFAYKAHADGAVFGPSAMGNSEQPHWAASLRAVADFHWKFQETPDLVAIGLPKSQVWGVTSMAIPYHAFVGCLANGLECLWVLGLRYRITEGTAGAGAFGSSNGRKIWCQRARCLARGCWIRAAMESIPSLDIYKLTNEQHWTHWTTPNHKLFQKISMDYLRRRNACQKTSGMIIDW